MNEDMVSPYRGAGFLDTRDPKPAEQFRLPWLAHARPVHLISHIGFQDCDVLPLWIDHYRRLGIDDIRLVIHGAWSERRALADICHQNQAVIANEYEGPYGDVAACAALTELARRFIGDWILLADADEFIELPLGSLTATIRALRAFGMTSLPALMVQRVTADGSLPPVAFGTNLPDTFPFANTLLIERMGGKIDPPWKSKFPLFLVHSGTRVRRGSHLAPDDNGISGFGIRAVVHHYKWRANMLRGLTGRASNDPASGHEKRVVADWLAANRGRLPIEGAFACSREELLRRALLRCPTRKDIAMGVLLHRVRLQGTLARGLSIKRLTHKLAHLDDAWQTCPSSRDGVPARASTISSQPARIAIVAFQISPPDFSSGIATWTIAAAESLKRCGHEVTIVYVPFIPSAYGQLESDVWESRGIEVMVVSRTAGEINDSDPMSIVGARLLKLFEERRFDLIHLQDAWGYGAKAVSARRQGHALLSTRFVVTAHGPLDWYSRGNDLLRLELEFRGAHLERVQAEAADSVVGPSALIVSWLGKSGYHLPKHTYVHPNPLSHRTWAGRPRQVGACTPIGRFVFFGRMEPLKGLALFCDAVDRLQNLTDQGCEIIFLGHSPKPEMMDYVEIRSASWRFRTVRYGNWMSEDALLLLGEPGMLAVIPSLIDNSPYAVLECLGAGIPFISTNVGGIPELVHAADRERVLVEPQVEALAAALQRALTQGHAPARPAHDFATNELQWLAWHGSLLEAKAPTAAPPSEAARPEGGRRVALLVPFGTGQVEPWCLESLRHQDGVRVEFRTGGACEERELTAHTANVLARETQSAFLVFCGPRVVAEGGAVAALMRAALNTGADAVVASHRLARGAPQSSGAMMGEVIHPPCGPLSIAAVENVFGGRFFLIRRAAFDSLGGFRERPQLDRIEHRDLLNRLLLKGGRIVSVPYPLYVEYAAADEPEGFMHSAKRVCLEPFLQGIPSWLSDLVSWAQDSGWPAQDRPIDDIGWSIIQAGQAAARNRLAGIHSGVLLVKLASVSELGRLEAGGDAQLQPAEGCLSVMAEGPDPTLLLPAKAVPASPSALHLIVDLVAPGPTEAQLFWQTNVRPDYVEERSVRAKLTGGRQTVLLSTPPIVAAGQCRFDPGLHAGQYDIYSLELWAVPNPGNQ